MKKNYSFLIGLFSTLLLSLPPATAVAQSASKQINEIKRNDAYLFDEATAATAEEAREAALVKLAKVLADYMTEKNPEGAKKLDDFKDLAEGAEEIVADRGSQKRVFLYFKKSDIDATADDAAQKDKDVQPTSQQKEVPSVPFTANGPVKAPSNPAVEPAPTAEPVPATKPVPATQPKPVVEKTADTPTASPAVNDNSLAEWQKRVVEKFAGVTTLLQAKDLANTFRIENKIKRYGTNNTQPKNPAESFYVIADTNGHIVAVLGRNDNGQRLNYKTGAADDLNKYQSFDYIWFTLNK